MKQYRLNREMHKRHDISKDELSELFEYANYSCMYCGISEEESLKVFGEKLHKDHAYNDGSNGIDNCILACKSCNSTKHKKDWNEWYTPENEKFNPILFNKIIKWLNKFIKGDCTKQSS